MTENPQRPDRAGDDDLDVPTYNPSAPRGESSAPAGPKVPSVYERAGRVAPQEVRPAAAAQRPEDTPGLEARTEAYADVAATEQIPAVDPDSRVAPAAAAAPERTAATGYPVGQQYGALASDAPTTFFDEPAQGAAAPAPEPLSGYQEPGDSEAAFAPAEDYAASYAQSPAAVPLPAQEKQRRGTLDFGLFILRISFGLMLVVHALATFFGFGGSTGLSGLETEFAAYAMPGTLAVVLPSLELAAGLFIFLGLLTPVAAAVGLVYAVFMVLHAGTAQGGFLSLSSLDDHMIVALLTAVVALSVQFTGPGTYSLDFARSWARRPLASSWVCVAVAIAATAALWWFGAGVNPV